MMHTLKYRRHSLVMFSLLFIVTIVSTGCDRRVSENSRVNPALLHQLSALSVLGQNQALAIYQESRELTLTTDGGKTWKTIPPSAVNDAFELATMIDGQRGWAVNHQGEVFQTDSGGTSWTKISALKDFTCGSQIIFLNDKEGWIRDCLILWRTRDGGVTWQKMLSVTTPGVAGQPSGMFVIDTNRIVVSGSGGQVLVTKDGGENWSIQSPFGGDHIDYSDVWFVDQKHGWLVGTQILVAGESSRPLLFETVDGGDSWRQIPLDADIRPSSVCFVGETGWLAGSKRIVNGNSVRLEGVLLHSTDTGKSWKPVELGPNEQFLTEVRFTDKDNGWLLGRDSLSRTEDGGKTWVRVLKLPPPKENAAEQK